MATYWEIWKRKLYHMSLCLWANRSHCQNFNTNNINIQNQLNYIWTIRKINKYSIAEFLSKLNYESGETFSFMTILINI